MPFLANSKTVAAPMGTALKEYLGNAKLKAAEREQFAHCVMASFKGKIDVCLMNSLLNRPDSSLAAFKPLIKPVLAALKKASAEEAAFLCCTLMRLKVQDDTVGMSLTTITFVTISN